jgi:hypothetical protein
MTNNCFEQCIKLKFLEKLNTTATKRYTLLEEIYGKPEISKGRVFKWHIGFSGGKKKKRERQHP